MWTLPNPLMLTRVTHDGLSFGLRRVHTSSRTRILCERGRTNLGSDVNKMFNYFASVSASLIMDAPGTPRLVLPADAVLYNAWVTRNRSIDADAFRASLADLSSALDCIIDDTGTKISSTNGKVHKQLLRLDHTRVDGSDQKWTTFAGMFWLPWPEFALQLAFHAASIGAPADHAIRNTLRTWWRFVAPHAGNVQDDLSRRCTVNSLLFTCCFCAPLWIALCERDF